MRRCVTCGSHLSSSGWRCAACGFEPQQRERSLGFPVPAFAETGGYDPAHFERLFQCENHHFWFGARRKLILWCLSRYQPQLASFFEVGCGTGYVLMGIGARWPKAALTGSDLFAEGLNFAATRVPQATLLQLDARNMPFIDEFDAVGAFDVLEHIEEDEDVLAQMFQALKPGGCVVLTVPQHPSLWSVNDVAAHHVRRYEVGELKRKLATAGFDVKVTGSFVSLPFPLMALSRWRRRNKNPADADAGAELVVSPLLNTCMRVVLALEHGLFRLGIRFPFGGSQVAVGRKPLVS